MPNVKTYHRPTDTETALTLLAQNPGALILAGGTTFNTQPTDNTDTLIDLQAAGLNGITAAEGSLTLGAMVRLQTLVECPDAPGLLRELAHREAPNTLRNAATLGGTIITANWQSELLAGLLVFNAQVELKTAAKTSTIPLADFLANPHTWLQNGTLLTAVSLETTGIAAAERVARTPADQPIVAAVARKTRPGETRLALCGIATIPILINPGQLEALQPPSDFRGSSEYRLAMAKVLTERVLEQIK